MELKFNKADIEKLLIAKAVLLGIPCNAVEFKGSYYDISASVYLDEKAAAASAKLVDGHVIESGDA